MAWVGWGIGERGELDGCERSSVQRHATRGWHAALEVDALPWLTCRASRHDGHATASRVHQWASKLSRNCGAPTLQACDA